MRQRNLTLCAAGAAALLSLESREIVQNGFAGTVAAARSESGRPILLDGRNRGSVVDLGGGLVEAGVRDGLDQSDVWSQPRGIDAEPDADGEQALAQANVWNEWIERQVLNLPGVTEAADAGPEGSKWTFLLIAFAGLTAALSGRRRPRRAVIAI